MLVRAVAGDDAAKHIARPPTLKLDDSRFPMECQVSERENSMKLSIIDEVVEQLKNMPKPLQWQVLEFVRTLGKLEVQGVSGRKLLQFAGSIPADDLQLMREAIEQDCNGIDLDEW